VVGIDIGIERTDGQRPYAILSPVVKTGGADLPFPEFCMDGTGREQYLTGKGCFQPEGDGPISMYFR